MIKAIGPTQTAAAHSQNQFSVFATVVISTGLLPHPSASGVAQPWVVVKPRLPHDGREMPQAIAGALPLAFHMNSPIASMFSKFQAMPLRNAAA